MGRFNSINDGEILNLLRNPASVEPSYALQEDLIKQIGLYAATHQPIELNQDAEQRIMRGTNAYKADHFKKVQQFLKSQANPDIFALDEQDSQFFRKAFAIIISQPNFREQNQFKGDEGQRKNLPETATIRLEQFLGTTGMKLYQMALEEEMYSSEYRHAVLNASTKEIEGKSWKVRPVVIVAGPSGCGKSFAADYVIQTAKEFLPQDDVEPSGNDAEPSKNQLVALDGGIARSVSQMRNLVIQSANNAGYSGISDLHAKSAVLEKFKPHLQAAAFKMPKLGIVIPETFSIWINPFSKIRHLMKTIDRLPKTIQIFCHIKGENPSIFRRVVQFMASRRAWKTKDFDYKKPDLNHMNCESKGYNKLGFRYGISGSQNAENWYKQHSKYNLRFIITNDLILLKPDLNQSNTWIPAKQGDEGALLISSHAFEAWKHLQKTADLTQEQLKQKALSLPEFNKQCPPLVKTSGEVDLAIALEKMRRYVASLKKQNQPVKLESKIKASWGETVHLTLENINLRDLNSVRNYFQQFSNLVNRMLPSRLISLPKIFMSEPRKITTDLLRALKKIEFEQLTLHRKDDVPAVSDQSTGDLPSPDPFLGGPCP